MIFRLSIIALSISIFCFGIYLLTDVKTTLSPEDIHTIQDMNLDAYCKDIDTFEQELSCIHQVQITLLENVPDMRCAHKVDSQEPADFVARGYGCCFSRSRFIEKTLNYYGFEVRHISLHILSYPIIGYILPARSSHSTSEVLTQKGWMYTDSNAPFYLITKDEMPLDIRTFLSGNFWDQVKTRPSPELFFQKGTSVFYGLYSRHGQFYPPFIFLPDIDWAQIHHNFQ